MDDNYKEVLEVVNEVKLDVRELKTTVEKSVESRFRDHDRRIGNLELNQRWVVLAVIGGCITALMSLIIR